MVTPYYQDDWCTIYHGDCLEVLPQLDVQVDLVLTDPPYGINKAVWDTAFPYAWYLVVRQLNCPVYIVTGSCGLGDSIQLVGDDFVDVIAARNLNGVTRGPLGFGNWLATVVANGKPPQGQNAFDFVVREQMPSHPTPKPIEFVRRLLQRISRSGSVILDPFMGSGTTLRAAKDLGRRAIGIEICEEYCAVAAKRLQQEVLPLRYAEAP